VADPAQVAGVISDFRTAHRIPHRVSCRALGVSESWFYKHRTRRPTRREVRRQQLAEAVQEEFTDSGGTYGSPKIWIRLVRQGITSEPFWIVSLSVAGDGEDEFRELALVKIDANNGKIDSVRQQR
jgi:hypothetical protein